MTSQGFVEDGNKVHSASGINIMLAQRTTRSTEITRVSQARLMVLDRKALILSMLGTKSPRFPAKNDVERSALDLHY